MHSQDDFNRAAKRVRDGEFSNISDIDQLRLYGLYSVALKGSAAGPAPSTFSIRESAKYSAWVDASELTKEQAQAEYVKLIERLGNGGKRDVLEKQAPTGFQIGGNTTPTLDICHWASIGDVRSVLYCLRRGSPDYQDEMGLTPLMRAADRGHLHVVDALLDVGANLELKDEDGSTALHYAAICGHAVIAGVLILAGASLEEKDNDGATPLDLAPDDITKSIINQAKAGTWFRPPRPETIALRKKLGVVAALLFFMLLVSVVIGQWRGK